MHYLCIHTLRVVLRCVLSVSLVGIVCSLFSLPSAFALTAADATVANTFAFSCLSAQQPLLRNAWNSPVHMALFGMAFSMIPVQEDSTDQNEQSDSLNPSNVGELLVPQAKERVRSVGGGARNGVGRLGAPLPSGYSYSASVDSTVSSIRVRETYDNHDFSIPQTLTLDEYVERRRQYLQRRAWDSLTKEYDLQKALEGNDLAGILGRAANMIIPIPDNPLLGIFGKPEISINVNGEVNVRGGWRWDSQNLGTVSAFGQTQSGPVFSQDIRVNVSGRIGDKMKLGVNWDTKEQFEFNNTFRIGYDGYGDDIIRKVEAGNVQLQTPSTLIGGSQALFGVRADFQFGPLLLKTLASQKRGQRRFVSLKGGNLKQQFSLRAYDYAENHFFLDSAYKSIYNEYYRVYPPTNPRPNTPIGDLSNQLTVKDIEVWVSTTNAKEQALAKQGVAYDALPSIPSGGSYGSSWTNPAETRPGEIVQGRFVKLETNQFEFDPTLGTITILNLNKSKTYAVAYRIENKTIEPINSPTSDDLVYGTFAKDVGDSAILVLKLVYAPGFHPGFTTLWDRQLKNIYQIGPNNVNVSESNINIWYFSPKNDSTDVLPGSNQKLVSLMRVDQVANGTNQEPPDGQFDIQSSFFFNPTRGEIVFPNLEPFASGLTSNFAQYAFHAVYDTTKEVARQQTQFDRFVISGEAAGRAGTRISLPSGFNLAPGSVRVTLSGRELQEGKDYTVEYYSGQINLVSPEASLPGADINVEYEQNDIFNLSTRTLVGARADFDWKTILRSRDIKLNLGSTFMSYDQSLVIDRVRIGDEPVSNMMFGFDGTMNWNARWLTKLADALPLYDTKEPSSIDVRGEWAMMLPEPNKKYSDIPSDNGASVAYVDDFEGAQIYIPLGLTPTQWTHSSAPVDSSIAESDSLRSLYRGRMYWWRYFIGRTRANEVYPNKSTLQGQANISELLVNFEPEYRGIYNANANYIDSSSFTTDSLSHLWGGMMRLLSSFNTNFDAQNIDYIEVMMKLEPGTDLNKAKMFIDLGQISEDVIPNKRTDTEDGITSANPTVNGIVDAGEDVGIDGIENAVEKTVYPGPLSQENDPARDDYFFDFSIPADKQEPKDFVRYNNYEGNASQSQSGQFPDTEVLNQNNGNEISRNNSYFSYELDLNPDPLTNPQIVGSNGGWNLYRIPIRGRHKKVGNPSFANVQYVRVSFKGGRVHARIADWRLAGAYWQRFNANASGQDQIDTTLSVSFVNREENSGPPDYYTLPPGVNPPRQQSGTNNDVITLNEQSLAVSVKNLRYGDERTAVRFFRPFDMFYYKELKFFIHGDGSMPDRVTDRSAAPAMAYVRFGTDSLNYYEYNRPLVQGWQDLGIVLEQLTAIKQLRAPGTDLVRQEFPVPNDPLARFAVRGNPSLTRIQFVGVGIANPAERFPQLLSTTMWVDELRVVGAESSSDWGGVFSTQVKVADLGNVNFNFNRTNPNFHRLEERFGNRIQTTNWNVSANMSFDKFFSKEWYGTSIPFTYTHSESFQDPLFVSQSDINIEEAAAAAKRQALSLGATEEQADIDSVRERTRSQTLTVQDQWAITGLRIGLPSKKWYIRDTFNKLTFGFNYNQMFERSPVVAERFRWEWQFTGNYSVTIPPDYTVKPLKWLDGIPILESYKDYTLSYTPGNFASSLNLSRGRTTEQSRYLDVPSPVVRHFSAERQAQFTWKLSENGLLNPTLDYSLGATSTLVPLELDFNQRQRTSGDIFNDIFFHNGKIVNLGNDSRYTQTFTLNFKPKFPAVVGIDKYFDATGTFSTNYAWEDKLSKDPAYADINKSARWDNTIRFGLGISLKSMSDVWYGRGTLAGPRNPQPTDPKPEGGVLQGVLDVVKFVFLDYDKVTINFNQSNSSTNPGILGGTGVTNFWTRAPFGRDEENIFGPTAAYQLGLVGSPHGGFRMLGSSSFPFIRFETYTGVRAANASLFDNFSQQSSLDMRTSRPLWPGATLELNWRSQFKYNKNQKLLTDAAGVPSFSNIVVEEGYNRTFITLPDFLIFGLFDNTVEHVVELYRERRATIEASTADTVRRNQLLLDALASSFEDGLEAFNFFPGVLRQIMPRVNWALRWNGLEKWSLFEGFARSISLEHRYASTYQSNAKITDQGRSLESQQIDMGFEPLIGINMQFDEKKLDGNLTGSLRYTTKTGYRLSSSVRATISRNVTQELSIQASYNKRGFNFPLFGLELQNDLELSFQGTYRRTKSATFDVNNFDGENGRTLDGSTQIIVEPRARYTISRQVTASAFFRYEANLTEGAARPGNSTTQVGVDVRISISGGR